MTATILIFEFWTSFIVSISVLLCKASWETVIKAKLIGLGIGLAFGIVASNVMTW